MISEELREKLNRILVKAGDVSFRRRVIKVVEYLNVQKGDRILDCGCGEGFYTMVLRELYGSDCSVVSFDMDFELMKKARAWQKEDSQNRFALGDVVKLPFKDGTFDKIIFSEVLEHIPDEHGALLELKRVLKTGGVIALTVPNHNYPLLWDPVNAVRENLGKGHCSPDNGFWGGLWAMHLRLYYLNDLEALIRSAGFSMLERSMITHYCLPFNHMILYVGKRMGNVIPVPKSLRSSMEKFEWKEAQAGKMNFFVKAAMNLINFIDKYNDNVEDDLAISSVCIAMKLMK